MPSDDEAQDPADEPAQDPTDETAPDGTVEEAAPVPPDDAPPESAHDTAQVPVAGGLADDAPAEPDGIAAPPADPTAAVPPTIVLSAQEPIELAALEQEQKEARDRSTVQADLRKERKKARKHRHRWLRRTLYSLLSLVVLAVAAGAGIYFYAGYRFDQIKKVHAKHLIKQAAPGKPFNLLLVGSDSRAFVDNPTENKAFGNEGNAGGQRSDVTMVARFVPATKSVTILSIPRDLWVDIPANKGDIQGMNRINAAYDTGPDLLVETIEKDLDIPINHYMAVNFPGFQGMVDALGGVNMDFPTEVRDSYTGLDVTTLGCQLVGGQEALQLVRARHLEYKNSNGYWEYDGLSDFSRIQRQDSFFRAVLAKVNQSIYNPLAMNGFLSAAVGNLTIDDTLSKGNLFSIATEFKGLSSSHLITETLPTKGYVTDGGADVLLAAQPYAQNVINTFNQIGLPKPKTPKPPAPESQLPHDQVDVQVLNAGAVAGAAHAMADALTTAGYHVVEIGDASTSTTSGSTSEIKYGPTGKEAAYTLGASLTGAVQYETDPSLTGNTVSLYLVGSQLSVTGSTTTTTTVPGTPSTTTTIPGDVYTNTQSEPWNPVPCTLGS